jgi:hypothetical protein
MSRLSHPRCAHGKEQTSTERFTASSGDDLAVNRFEGFVRNELQAQLGLKAPRGLDQDPD